MTTPALLQLDLSDWLPVTPPAPPSYPFLLSASPSGHITLSQRLCAAMRETSGDLTFRFQRHPECRLLSLTPDPSGPYRFPRGGRIKDVEFTRTLISAGVSLPARYQVEWNPSVNAWIACLTVSGQSVTSQDALSASLAARARRRKGKG